MARYSAAAMEFTTMPIAGAVLGHYIDAYLKTDPALTIVFLIVGFIGGTINLIRQLSILQKTDSDTDG